MPNILVTSSSRSEEDGKDGREREETSIRSLFPSVIHEVAKSKQERAVINNFESDLHTVLYELNLLCYLSESLRKRTDFEAVTVFQKKLGDSRTTDFENSHCIINYLFLKSRTIINKRAEKFRNLRSQNRLYLQHVMDTTRPSPYQKGKFLMVFGESNTVTLQRRFEKRRDQLFLDCSELSIQSKSRNNFGKIYKRVSISAFSLPLMMEVDTKDEEPNPIHAKTLHFRLLRKSISSHRSETKVLEEICSCNAFEFLGLGKNQRDSMQSRAEVLRHEFFASSFFDYFLKDIISCSGRAFLSNIGFVNGLSSIGRQQENFPVPLIVRAITGLVQVQLSENMYFEVSFGPYSTTLFQSLHPAEKNEGMHLLLKHCVCEVLDIFCRCTSFLSNPSGTQRVFEHFTMSYTQQSEKSQSYTFFRKLSQNQTISKLFRTNSLLSFNSWKNEPSLCKSALQFLRIPSSTISSSLAKFRKFPSTMLTLRSLPKDLRQESMLFSIVQALSLFTIEALPFNSGYQVCSGNPLVIQIKNLTYLEASKACYVYVNICGNTLPEGILLHFICSTKEEKDVINALFSNDSLFNLTVLPHFGPVQSYSPWPIHKNVINDPTKEIFLQLKI